MTIGEKIKARRIELGWSQQQLADKMDYTSKSTITRIEKGINDVAQKNIKKFADVLGVSIAYLMDWTDEDSKLAVNKDNELAEFLECYNSANPELRKAALAVLKSAAPPASGNQKPADTE